MKYIFRLMLSYLIIIILYSTSFAQWCRLNAPNGGYFYIEKRTDNKIYAYSQGKEFFSTNEGKDWKPDSSGYNNTRKVLLNGFTIDEIKDVTIQDSKAFICVKDKGIYCSTNKGQSWQTLNNGLKSLEVEKVAADSVNIIALSGNAIYLFDKENKIWNLIRTNYNNENIVLISISGSSIVYNNSSGEIEFSDNLGRNWRCLNTGREHAQINKIVAKGNILYAGTRDGVYYSTNFGKEWQPLGEGLRHAQIESLAYNETGLYAADETSLYLLNEGQNKWVLFSNNIQDEVPVNKNVSIQGSKIFFGGSGLYVTVDKGANWEKIYKKGFTAMAVKDSIIILRNNNGLAIYNGKKWNESVLKFINVPNISVLIYKTKIFIGSLNGFYYTTNYGETWNEVISEFSKSGISSLVENDGNLYAAVEGKGIYLSSDGGETWKSIIDTAPNKYFFKIIICDNKIFALAWKGIFVYKKESAQWIECSNGLPYEKIVSVALEKQNIVFAENYQIFVSKDIGNSWSLIYRSKNLAVLRNVAIYNNQIIVKAYDYSSQSDLFLSNDWGNNWKSINYHISHNQSKSFFINEGKFYLFDLEKGLYVSTNCGNDWHLDRTFPYLHPITAFLVDEDGIFIGTNMGVYFTFDKGKTWLDKNYGLEDYDIKKIIRTDKNIYLLTSSKVYSTNDKCNTWKDITHGLPISGGYKLLLYKNNYLAWNPSSVCVTNTNGGFWKSIKFFPDHDEIIKNVQVQNESILILTNRRVLYATNENYEWKEIKGNSTNCLQTIYVINGGFVFSGNENGLYKTNDLGINWIPTTTGLFNKEILELSLNGTTMFCRNKEHIYYSTNYGAEWKQLDTLLNGIYVRNIQTDGNSIYALLENDGLYVSSDYGKSWALITQQLNNQGIYNYIVFSSLIVVNTDKKGCLVSKDKGKTWENGNEGLAGRRITKFINDRYKSIIAFAGDDVFCLEYNNQWGIRNNLVPDRTIYDIISSGENVIANAYQNGIYLTTNKGLNWENIGSPKFDCNKSQVVADENAIIVLIRDSLYVSFNNGKIWNLISVPSSIDNIYSVQFIKNKLYICTELGPFISSNYGESWESISNGLSSNQITAIASKGKIIYAGTCCYGIFVSKDEGKNWESISKGIRKIDRIDSIIIEKDSVYITSDYDIFSLQAGNNTWVKMDNGSINKALFQRLTKDDGRKWRKFYDSTGCWIDNTIILNNKYILAGTNNGLFCSPDSGKTWKCLKDGLPFKRIDALINRGDNVFAACEKKIFLSQDKGVTWENVSDGFPDSYITALGMNEDYLFAATMDSTIWKRPLSEMIEAGH